MNHLQSTFFMYIQKLKMCNKLNNPFFVALLLILSKDDFNVPVLKTKLAMPITLLSSFVF